MEHIFRIFDFNVYNGKENTKETSDDEHNNTYKDNTKFMIQIFGIIVL